MNSGISASGFTASDMVSIPNISTAKPIMIVAISLCFSFLLVIKIATPAMASTGEKEDGFKSCKKKLEPSTPVRLRNHAVIVVPTLAPKITPTAWESFIIPEFTKPTTITVVAEEDWITAVTPAPRSTAISLLLVSFSKMISSLPPDAFFRPSPRTSIPYKKSASPPIRLSKIKISIPYPSGFCVKHR